MGSIPHDGGTTFRVWAPHARAVGVAGSFNGWSAGDFPLAPDGDSGYCNTADPFTDLPDGWRLMQLITGDTDDRQPWKLHIAEDLRDDPAITNPVEEGGAGFDAQWDGAFVHPVRGVLIPWSDGGRNMWALRDAIARGDGVAALRRVIYTESHDEVATWQPCPRAPRQLLLDRETWKPGRLRKSLRALRTNPFLSMQVLRDLRDYNRRDFHPDDHDNKALTEHWRTELFAAGGTLTPRLAGVASDAAD